MHRLQVAGQELHHGGRETHLAGDPGDLVALVGEEQQLRLDTAFPGSSRRLPGFADRDVAVVDAVDDEQRRAQPVKAAQRRQFGKQIGVA